MTKLTVQQIYDQVAPIYDEVYQQEKYRNDELRTAELLSEINPSGFIICQGIGTGQDFEMINPGPDDLVLGLDISPEMLKIAREKFPQLQTQVWDCNNVYPANADTVISLYGTINYVGLESFCEQIVASGAKKFFGVMFSPLYVPELAPQHTKWYKLQEIDDIMESYGLYWEVIPLFGDDYYSQDYWVIRNA